jgi:hypothetical protein
MEVIPLDELLIALPIPPVWTYKARSTGAADVLFTEDGSQLESLHWHDNSKASTGSCLLTPDRPHTVRSDEEKAAADAVTQDLYDLLMTVESNSASRIALRPITVRDPSGGVLFFFSLYVRPGRLAQLPPDT